MINNVNVKRKEHRNVLLPICVFKYNKHFFFQNGHLEICKYIFKYVLEKFDKLNNFFFFLIIFIFLLGLLNSIRFIYIASSPVEN